MVPILHSIYSYDVIKKLDEYLPENPKYFELDVVLEIGARESRGADLFYLTICSIDWFAKLITEESSGFLQHYLVVDEYDYEKIEEIIKSKLSRISGKDWADLSNKISKLARWEFENYTP